MAAGVEITKSMYNYDPRRMGGLDMPNTSGCLIVRVNSDWTGNGELAAAAWLAAAANCWHISTASSSSTRHTAWWTPRRVQPVHTAAALPAKCISLSEATSQQAVQRFRTQAPKAACFSCPADLPCRHSSLTHAWLCRGHAA